MRTVKKIKIILKPCTQKDHVSKLFHVSSAFEAVKPEIRVL